MLVTPAVAAEALGPLPGALLQLLGWGRGQKLLTSPSEGRSGVCTGLPGVTCICAKFSCPVGQAECQLTRAERLDLWLPEQGPVRAAAAQGERAPGHLGAGSGHSTASCRGADGHEA